VFNDTSLTKLTASAEKRICVPYKFLITRSFQFSQPVSIKSRCLYVDEVLFNPSRILSELNPHKCCRTQHNSYIMWFTNTLSDIFERKILFSL
jgi:hypothetical protein